MKSVNELVKEMVDPKNTCKSCDFEVCPMLNIFSGLVKAAHEREMAQTAPLDGSVTFGEISKMFESTREVIAGNLLKVIMALYNHTISTSDLIGDLEKVERNIRGWKLS